MKVSRYYFLLGLFFYLSVLTPFSLDDFSFRRIKEVKRRFLIEYIKKNGEAKYDWEAEKILRFYEEIKEIVNSEGKDLVVFYPGIGGGYSYMFDIFYPVLATGCRKIIGIEIEKYDPDRVRLLPAFYGEVISINKVEYLEDQKKLVISFNFLGEKECEAVIYFEKDAGEWIPPELKEGYDVLFTRNLVKGSCIERFKKGEPIGLTPLPEVWKQWLQFLKGRGYLITSGGAEANNKYADIFLGKEFWGNFELVKVGKGMVDIVRDLYLLKLKINPS